MASLAYYLRLGGKTMLLSLLAAAALWLLFVLRPRKKRALEKGEKLKWFLTFWYGGMLFLLVFFGDRVQTRRPPFSAAVTAPFHALREVLVSTNSRALVLLVLNVLAFVPLGLLLVWHARGRAQGRRLHWLVLLVPLAVELIQFATGLGLLETDDWITNVLGGAWGLCLGEWFAERKTKNKAVRFGLLAVLPLALAAIGAGLWLARPYGFLPQELADPAQPRPAEVSVDRLEGLGEGLLPVYRMLQPGKAAAAGTADRLFGALGLTRRTDLEDVYDDCAVYYAQDSKVYAWVYFNGSFYLRVPEGLPCEGPREEAVLRLLEQAGYTPPPASAVEEERMVWDFVADGDRILSGEICFMPAEGRLERVYCFLRSLEPALERPALDAAAVRADLLRGRFSAAEGAAGARIECLSARVVYAPDSRGFFRPLYELDCLADGEPATLLTPAC